MPSRVFWISKSLKNSDFCQSMALACFPCRCGALQYIAIGNGLSSLSQNSSSPPPPTTRFLNPCTKRLDNDSASIHPALRFGHLSLRASKSSPMKKFSGEEEKKSWYASSVRKGQYTSVEASMCEAASPTSVAEGVERMVTPRLCRNCSSVLENDGSCA